MAPRGCGCHEDRGGAHVRRDGLERARPKARARGADPAAIDAERFTLRASAEIVPDAIEGRDAADVTTELRARVSARVTELEAKRGRAPGLGMLRARPQSVWDAPRRPKRGPIHLCHASTAEAWRAHRDAWREFVALFRWASEQFPRRVGGVAGVDSLGWVAPFARPACPASVNKVRMPWNLEAIDVPERGREWTVLGIGSRLRLSELSQIPR